MNAVTMYTSATCPFCVRAEQLLAAKGVQNILRIHVDASPEHRAEMIARSGGRRTVPQIFIDEHHVGGFDDLAASNRSGALDVWLRDRRGSPKLA